jgi:hypothetical protein
LHQDVEHRQEVGRGLCGDDSHDVVADYTMQAKELYRQIALKIFRLSIREFEDVLRHNTDGTILHSSQPLLLLYHVDHPVDELNDSPSWVVDWSKPRVTASLAATTEVFNCFYAGKSSLTSMVLQISEDESMLRLRAKLFDKIECLSPIIGDTNLEASSSSSKNSALRTCIAFVLSAPLSLNGKVSFPAFCQVLTAGKDITGRQKYPAAYTEIISFLCDTVTGKTPTFSDQIYSPRQQKGRLTLNSLATRSCGRTFQDFKEAFKLAVRNRRLCWTEKGHLGLVPRFAKAGDSVIVVPGAAAPFVIRRAGERDERASSYRFIGECFVDRIMQGEVMADDDIALTDLDIV